MNVVLSKTDGPRGDKVRIAVKWDCKDLSLMGSFLSLMSGSFLY